MADEITQRNHRLGENIAKQQTSGQENFSRLRVSGSLATRQRISRTGPIDQSARAACQLMTESGFALVTGGAPGIMEAAIEAAIEAQKKGTGSRLD